MGPQQETAPPVKSWPEREKARLNEALGGRWECWYTPVYQPSGYAWSARPAGASASVCQAAAPDELLEKIAAYEQVLTAHIARARQELAETPESWTGRRDLLLSRLDALRTLQSVLPAATDAP